MHTMTRIRPQGGRSGSLLRKIVAAVTRRTMGKVADAAWEEAHRYFSDRETVELNQTPSRGAA
jgi:hypothetical protein